MPRKKLDNLTLNTTQRTTGMLEFDPKFEELDCNIFVQFGKAIRHKPRPRVTVNYLKGLMNTRNKLKQHQLLQEADIQKPDFLRTAEDAEEWLDHNDGALVAKRVNHSRGRGMYKINGVEELYNTNPAIFDADQYYFEEFVTCNREWRIHVSQYHEEAVVAYRKCLRGEIVERWRNDEIRKPWMRNIDTCYYKLDSEEDRSPWWDDIVSECKRAIDILGIDIAGIDVGENNKVEGGKFYIFEVNSACGMEENTRSAYESAIEDIITAKAKRKGFIQ